MKEIFCTYEDTEVASLWVKLKCPYCGYVQDELDMTECGSTYKVVCEQCEEKYKMYFDAD